MTETPATYLDYAGNGGWIIRLTSTGEDFARVHQLEGRYDVFLTADPDAVVRYADRLTAFNHAEREAQAR